ncbi:MAG: YciI family protein [Chthoniobacterales bacterium]|nr:YciI family protein [Chthoniobacterales bacterium]
MKYALLVHQSQEQFDKRDNAAAMAAGRAYSEALQAAGVFVGGAGLESPQATTTVSIRDGKRQVHDGPYAETKEFLAGFGIIDVPDLDAALEWAARHPAAAFASVEVRPLLGSHFAVGGGKPS